MKICNDVNCSCHATRCVVDGKPIQPGDIVCSDLCNREADSVWDLATYTAIILPHS